MKQFVDAVRKAVRSIMRAVAVCVNTLSRGRITPNGVTWFGFVMHLPIALLIAADRLIWGGVLLVIFGLFDTLDGELARLQKRVTNHGGFLDATTDRFKEVLLYGGIAWLLARGDHPEYAAIAVVACGASLCVSYVKAKGEAVVASSGKRTSYPELNRMFSGGLFPFEIRMTVLVLGLLLDQLVLAISIIALCAAFTALYRMALISRSVQ
jgi:phosphatidylglycerophosphate synthase